MKAKKLFYTALVLSLLIWSGDTLIDYIIDGGESFLNLLVLRIPVNTLYFRLFLIFLFAILAILVYYESKRKKLMHHLDLQVPEYILDKNHEDYQVLDKFFHSIRTQLNNIVGFTSLLREKTSDSDAKIYLEYLESSKKALQDSVEVLLEVYREKKEISKKIKLPDEELDIDWSSKTILVAEDVETNYSLLKFMLKKTGVEIIWVKNGRQAVELIEQGKVLDLILMDILMPELDGMEATRRIKNIRPELPVIAQTAFSFSKDEITEGLFDEIILKPVWQYDLLKKCSKHLDG